MAGFLARRGPVFATSSRLIEASVVKPIHNNVLGKHFAQCTYVETQSGGSTGTWRRWTMFLFELLFVSVIHLAVIGLDIVGFFVVIRVLILRWPARPLLALDRVGEPVTDPLIEAVERAMPCAWITGEKRRQHFGAAAALLVLALCRLALAGLVA